MSTIPEIAKAMQTVLGESADKLAKETNFIKRERKFTGSTFARTLVFGWTANPESSLSELNQAAAASGIKVSSQALNKRFTEEAATFMYQLLETAVEQVISADSPAAIPIFQRFDGVYVDDGSVISLPEKLLSVWEGCGGSYGPTSGLKIQFSFDLKYGTIRKLCIRQAKEQDKNSPTQNADLPQKALRIHDKGFNSLAVMELFTKKDAYWLCPLKLGVNIYDKKDKKLDITSYLSSQSDNEVDLQIKLGTRKKLRCRLLAKRVPPEIAEERRQKIRQEAKRRQRTPSKQALELVNWVILITNVPKELLSVEEATILYRARWQIELIFKLWKDQYLVDEWRTDNEWRILCEIYAKLLTVINQHWIFLATCWQYADKSLMKAASTIQKYAFYLASVFYCFNRLCEALEMIKQCLETGCRIQKRKKKATFQLLTDLQDV